MENEIIERKKAEQAIQESEKRYKRLIQSVTDYIYTVQVENGRPIKTTHGPGCIGVTGYTTEDFDTDPYLWHRMIHEEDREKVTEYAQKALSGKVPPSLAHRITHKDGRIRWVENVIVLHFDKFNKLIAYDGLIKDITEHKRLEELLLENERYLKSILDSMHTGILIIDAETHIIADVNNFAANLIGAGKNDIIGSICHKFICPAERNKCPVTDLGQILDVSERALLNSAGRHIPILKSVREVEHKGRKYLIENFISIEERKQAEEALRKSEKRLRDITSSLAEGIYVLNEQGNIIFMNPEAERLFGWSMDELNEKGAHGLVHSRKANGTPLPFEECKMHNVIKTAEVLSSSEEVFIRKDGAVFPAAVITSPIMEDNKVIASVTAFRDITAQKEIEKEKETLISELQKALAKVKQLSGLLPICMYCKKIRDDKGYWEQLEGYISKHSEAEFSHGICPECEKKAYEELDKLLKRNNQGGSSLKPIKSS